MVKTAGILANGPSATSEDALKLRSIVDHLIAVNDAWRLCKGPDGKFFCDAVYGSDYRWWRWAHPDLSRDFDGELITQRIQWEVLPESWGMTCFESEPKPGLSTVDGTIHTGSNSSYAALNVAYQRGYRRIYFLGLDLSMDGERRHAVTGRPKTLDVGSNYQNFIEQFKTIDCKRYGLEVVNLSRKTALNHFELGCIDELSRVTCAA